MLRVLAACCVFLAAAPGVARAEWHLAAMAGATFFGSTTILDPEQGADRRHRQFGGAVALLGEGILGVEAIGSWTPGFFERSDGRIVSSSSVSALMGNIIVTTPRRWSEYSLRPYASAGLGLLRASQHPVAEQLEPTHLNLTGLNIGVGAVGFLSERTGLRFDLRYYRTLRSTDEGPVALGPTHLRYMAASVGIVWRR